MFQGSNAARDVRQENSILKTWLDDSMARP